METPLKYARARARVGLWVAICFLPEETCRSIGDAFAAKRKETFAPSPNHTVNILRGLEAEQGGFLRALTSA